MSKCRPEDTDGEDSPPGQCAGRIEAAQWSIDVRESLNCIFVKWGRAPALEDSRAYFEALQQLPAFHAGARMFNDLRALDPDLPTTFFRQAARLGPSTPTPAAGQKLALLVASDVAFGLMRIFATFRQRPGLEVGVFGDLEEAKAWLDLPAGIGDPFADMAGGRGPRGLRPSEKR